MTQTIGGGTKLPPRGGYTFTFEEAAHPEGGQLRTLTFADVNIIPRDYGELAEAVDFTTSAAEPI